MWVAVRTSKNGAEGPIQLEGCGGMLLQKVTKIKEFLAYFPRFSADKFYVSIVLEQ